MKHSQKFPPDEHSSSAHILAVDCILTQVSTLTTSDSSESQKTAEIGVKSQFNEGFYYRGESEFYSLDWALADYIEAIPCLLRRGHSHALQAMDVQLFPLHLIHASFSFFAPLDPLMRYDCCGAGVGLMHYTPRRLFPQHIHGAAGTGTEGFRSRYDCVKQYLNWDRCDATRDEIGLASLDASDSGSQISQ